MYGDMKLPLVSFVLTLFATVPLINAVDAGAAAKGKKHSPHHHHHHRHHIHHGHAHHHPVHHGGKQQRGAAVANTSPIAVANSTLSNSVVQTVSTKMSAVAEAKIQGALQGLEHTLKNVEACTGALHRGRLLVNAPIPPDFSERFQHAVAWATGCDSSAVSVVGTSVKDQDVVIIDFSAPANLVHSVEDQAADPESQLANGQLRQFLVADDAPASGSAAAALTASAPAPLANEPPAQLAAGPATPPALPASGPAPMANESPGLPTPQTDMDIDTEMPYGELEPFGREDTAQELSEQSIKESDSMVDQLERAEVAEEKRAVFRALTRLRGAAITSFDGIARSQTGNIDEYNKVHSWRRTHPLNHLADEESDVSKWAFPDDADF